jgi:hypothetical protein
VFLGCHISSRSVSLDREWSAINHRSLINNAWNIHSEGKSLQQERLDGMYLNLRLSQAANNPIATLHTNLHRKLHLMRYIIKSIMLVLFRDALIDFCTTVGCGPQYELTCKTASDNLTASPPLACDAHLGSKYRPN